jgi:probable HAF family extracellular repeat protein
MTDIGTLPGGDSSFGNRINDAGQVVGEALTSELVTHAVLYRDGLIIDLGALPNSSYATANAINNAGQVVGYSDTLNGFQRAFLYSKGQMRDLNDLIDPALGITLAQANAINDSGQIVANWFGSPDVRPNSYLLTPVPEPSPLALFGVALLGWVAWIRRHPSLCNRAGGRSRN